MLTFNYYVKEAAVNSVVVNPPVGKGFSAAERELIIRRLTDVGGLHVVQGTDQGAIRVVFKDYKGVDLVSIIEDALPKKATKKAIKAALDAAKRDAARAKEQARQAAAMSDEATVKWVHGFFGTSMNGYNTASMVEFLLGKSPVFSGLLNHAASEAMVKNGFIKGAGMDAMYDFDALKEHFHQSKRAMH